MAHHCLCLCSNGIFNFFHHDGEKKFEDTITRFDRIHERDRRTDRHTETAWRHRPRLHSIARQKLLQQFHITFMTDHQWYWDSAVKFSGWQHPAMGAQVEFAVSGISHHVCSQSSLVHSSVQSTVFFLCRLLPQRFYPQRFYVATKPVLPRSEWLHKFHSRSVYMACSGGGIIWPRSTLVIFNIAVFAVNLMNGFIGRHVDAILSGFVLTCPTACSCKLMPY